MKMSTLDERACGPSGTQEVMYSVVFWREKYIFRETPTVLRGGAMAKSLLVGGFLGRRVVKCSAKNKSSYS